MIGQGCLIIDDVSPALAALSDKGHLILRDATLAVRAAVRAYAQLRGWVVVAHEEFAEWARSQCTEPRLTWLTLDPFLSVHLDNANVHTLRVTRLPGIEGVVGDTLPQVAFGDCRMMGVVDDAVSSGRTLAHVHELIHAAGGTLGNVVVCASPRATREWYQRRYGKLLWADYFPGDWRVIHLRDGCPYLPFSGRASGIPDVLGDRGERTSMRMFPTAIEGNLWQVLWLDKSIKGAILAAQTEALRLLHAYLGRPAVVGDLTLLGPHIPALVRCDLDPEQEISVSSPLMQLLFAPAPS